MIAGLLPALTGKVQRSGGSSGIITPVSTRPRVLISSGQSNCGGYSSAVADIPPEFASYGQSNANVKIWNHLATPKAFETTLPGLNTDYPRDVEGYMPAWIPAMYDMNEFWLNNFADYVIHFAWGGMDIDNWLPPSGNFYDDMLAYVNTALAAISNDPNDYSVVFYWDQGENDANQGLAVAQQYESKFTTMIADYRANFNVRKLPVVLRKLAFVQQGVFNWTPEIRTQQENIVANVADCQLITSDDAEFESTNVHLTATGMITVAKKLAGKLIYLWD